VEETLGMPVNSLQVLPCKLAYNAPSLRRYISEAAEEQIDIANHSLRDQWRQIVIRPLLRLDKRLSPSSYLLVIDALDEYDNEDHIRTRVASKSVSQSSVKVIFQLIDVLNIV
jgi:hypothetical protein